MLWDTFQYVSIPGEETFFLCFVVFGNIFFVYLPYLPIILSFQRSVRMNVTTPEFLSMVKGTVTSSSWAALWPFAVIKDSLGHR